jgi:hypothetical protein
MNNSSIQIPMETLRLAIDDWAYRHHMVRVEYRQPKVQYDPFEIFKPSKTFLLEVIKKLKQQAYVLLKEKIHCNSTYGPAGWITQQYEQRHQAVCRRIRDYEWRIRQNTPGSERVNEIGTAHRDQAKQVPIQDFYIGTLRKAGSRHLGRCPFHQEKSASFVVYPDNTFHCFGCGAHGDSIAFVMKLNNLKFIEAIKLLCRI